jgi:hypothetical protein
MFNRVEEQLEAPADEAQRRIRSPVREKREKRRAEPTKMENNNREDEHAEIISPSFSRH